jgi:branched-chain amino acid transport system ATP-binding protein
LPISEIDPVLETRELSKRFGSLQAVDNVSIAFEKDRFTSIIGPNGAGKTTFFNLLTGNLKPTGGSVRYMGEEISGAEPFEIADRGIARSFQTSNVFSGLTVRENIRVGIQQAREWYQFWKPLSAFPDTLESADRILELVQLSDHRDKNAEDLSHADQRLLEVAISLSIDPEVLLLDEPTAGMSRDETDHIIDLLKQQVFPEVDLVVMIEHDMDVVMNHSDRTIVLHNGGVLVDGNPREVEQNEEVQRVYLGET